MKHETDDKIWLPVTIKPYGYSTGHHKDSTFIDAIEQSVSNEEMQKLRELKNRVDGGELVEKYGAIDKTYIDINAYNEEKEVSHRLASLIMDFLPDDKDFYKTNYEDEDDLIRSFRDRVRLDCGYHINSVGDVVSGKDREAAPDGYIDPAWGTPGKKPVDE